MYIRVAHTHTHTHTHTHRVRVKSNNVALQAGGPSVLALHVYLCLYSVGKIFSTFLVVDFPGKTIREMNSNITDKIS